MIRPLAAGDHEDWLALWRGYLDFYGVQLSAEQTSITWHRLIDPDEPIRGIVATVDGVVVGFAHVLPHSSTWAKKGYLYLEDLFVSPDARGTGLGRSLIEAVYQMADNAQFERVYWVTKEDNPARELYDKLATESGFVQYRR